MIEQGRRWILYELEIGDPDDKDPNHREAAVMQVDPQTKLPDSITVTRGRQKMQTTMFDYPAEARRTSTPSASRAMRGSKIECRRRTSSESSRSSSSTAAISTTILPLPAEATSKVQASFI